MQRVSDKVMGRGNLPSLKIYHISIAKSMRKTKLFLQIVKAAVGILWLLVVVVGLILLYV